MSGPRADMTWSLDVEVDEWLVVPMDADADWRAETIEQVRTAVSGSTANTAPDADSGPSANGGIEEMPSPGFIDELAAEAVDRLGAFAREVAPNDRVVAALGVPEHTPVPVLVTVAAVDEDIDLLAVAGAEQGRSVDAPRVEYLDLDEGDGIRVTRTDIDDRAVAWVSVSLAVRTELVDAVLHWRTTDFSVIPQMTERLDELLASIRIHPVSEGQE